MEQKLAMKWVKALRSGKYKQGKSTLCRVPTKENRLKKSRYCCLGALANVCGFKDYELKEYGLLNPKMKNAVGLQSYGGAAFKDGEILKIIINDSEYVTLADANDNGASFAKIATWIEKNYENL